MGNNVCKHHQKWYALHSCTVRCSLPIFRVLPQLGTFSMALQYLYIRWPDFFRLSLAICVPNFTLLSQNAQLFRLSASLLAYCAIWGNFAKALISENGNIAQKYEKLLFCKGYHILKYLYQSYKQLSIGRVLPPQMVPICSLAHGL